MLLQLRQKYIGQTKRNLITRLNEHRTRQSSEACWHLMENPKHTVNFDSPIIWTEVTTVQNYV